MSGSEPQLPPGDYDCHIRGHEIVAVWFDEVGDLNEQTVGRISVDLDELPEPRSNHETAPAADLMTVGIHFPLALDSLEAEVRRIESVIENHRVEIIRRRDACGAEFDYDYDNPLWEAEGHEMTFDPTDGDDEMAAWDEILRMASRR